jgi:hypothetical protein
VAQSKKPTVKIDLTQGPDLSDEALDALAEITPADIAAAEAMWNSKTQLPGLLSAKVVEPGQESDGTTS